MLPCSLYSSSNKRTYKQTQGVLVLPHGGAQHWPDTFSAVVEMEKIFAIKFIWQILQKGILLGAGGNNLSDA